MIEELEALYRERLSDFTRAATAIAGDEESGRDAVQEAFASAVRNRGSFRGDGPIEGWVWRMVVNAALMSRRAQASRAATLDAVTETTANGHEQSEPRIRAAVAALPERQRLVLFLRYFADLDYATIAEALEISPGTIGATLNNARASLRSVLEEVPR